MTIELPSEDFRELAETVLARALKEGGVVKAIQEAIEAQLALRGAIDKATAAKFLTVEERTLEIWCRKEGDRGGRGCPHTKIGETVRFRIESLDAWLKSHEVNPVLRAVA